MLTFLNHIFHHILLIFAPLPYLHPLPPLFLLLSPPLILSTRICIIFFLFSCYRNTFIFESRFLHEKKTLYLSCGWVVDIAKAKSLQRPYAKCKKAIFLQGPEQEVANAGQRQIQKWLPLEIEALSCLYLLCFSHHYRHTSNAKNLTFTKFSTVITTQVTASRPSSMAFL